MTDAEITFVAERRESEIDNARWLSSLFIHKRDGTVLYRREHGQLVRITSRNWAQWGPEINERRSQAFGPRFQFSVPTAEQMVRYRGGRLL